MPRGVLREMRAARTRQEPEIQVLRVHRDHVAPRERSRQKIQAPEKDKLGPPRRGQSAVETLLLGFLWRRKSTNRGALFAHHQAPDDSPHVQRVDPSLLARVRDLNDDEAWREFDRRYRDLVLRDDCRIGLEVWDADEMRHVVMMRPASDLRGFEFDPKRKVDFIRT